MRVFIDEPREKAHALFAEAEKALERKDVSRYEKLIAQLMRKEPNFLSSYAHGMSIAVMSNDRGGEIIHANAAYQRAVRLLIDKSGQFPEQLPERKENNHIIGALRNKAIVEWQDGMEQDALAILDKLVAMGIKEGEFFPHIVAHAIRMDLSFREFVQLGFTNEPTARDFAEKWYAENQ